MNTGRKATAGSPSATRPASNYPGNVRLAGAGALASIGTVGDSYDNALAESIIGLYKTECVRLDGPFKTVDELELATLSWVHWYNHQRLHSALDHIPPTETSRPITVTTTTDSNRCRRTNRALNPGRFTSASDRGTKTLTRSRQRVTVNSGLPIWKDSRDEGHRAGPLRQRFGAYRR